MGAKIKQHVVNNILNDFKNGMSRIDISKKYKISTETIKNKLKENIKDYNKFSIRIPQVIINKVLNLAETNYTITSIVNELNIDPNTVKRILSHYNVKLQERPSINIPTWKSKYDIFEDKVTPDIIQTKLNSSSLIQIISEYEINYEIIHKYIRNHALLYNKEYYVTNEIPQEIKNVIIEQYLQCETKRKLCDRFNISIRNLLRILDENNISRKQILVSIKNDEYQIYNKLARRLTATVKSSYKLISPKGYHWDHKISVYDGYKQNIPVYLIASMENLELIPSCANLKKGISSSITKEELYKLHGLIQF